LDFLLSLLSRKFPVITMNRFTRTLKILVFTLIVNFVFVVHAPNAVSNGSYIYFSVFDDPNVTHNIGRVSLDGTSNLVENLIVPNEAGWQDGQISIQGNYVYWVNGVKLFRNLKDGSGLKELIYTSASQMSSVETDSNYIYWSDVTNGKIGRAQLDGSAPNANFIVGTSPDDTNNDTYGLFVWDGYIYWANYDSDTIGRAQLDGTNVDNSFVEVEPGSGPCGVWASSTHLYWTNWSSESLGRSNLDGSLVNNFFITGLIDPFILIGNSTYIYWTDSGTNQIGRANLDGTGADLDFVELSLPPVGIWVENDGAAAPAAPTLNSVTSGDRRVTIAFTAGANNGAAITDYEYSLNGGAYTSAGTTTSPFTITGLSGRTAYSLTIKARNSVLLSTASSSLTATTTDSSLDANEAAAAEAARVAAAAEAAKKAKEQKELTELLSIIPSIAGLALNLGDLTNSLLTTKCVKGKTVKSVKKGAKCPKGYVKKK
jgi:virginiamycin B lyase